MAREATDEERQRDMQAVLAIVRLSEMDHQMAQERATQQRESAAAEGMALMSRAEVASFNNRSSGFVSYDYSRVRMSLLKAYLV